MVDLKKRTWAEVDLRSIDHNYHAIRSTLPKGTRFLGVVKADAYGHGAVQVAMRLEKLGAEYLAVSCLDEAMELRNYGISIPILILGHTPAEFTEELIDNNITQTITCEAKAVEYSKRAAACGKTMKAHIKVDTGMSRLGFLVAGDHFDGGVEGIVRSTRYPNLDVEGIFTHFAVSDEPDSAEDVKYTKEQFALFMKVIEACEKSGAHFKIRHCANTGAVVNYPETALDMVRPGIALYGYGLDSGRLGLVPAMRLVSTITTIKVIDAGTDVSYGRIFRTNRKTRMAIIGIGYADGLLRSASNKLSFATRYGMAPQIGRVCMDMCMLDITDLPKELEVGDEVEIFGPSASAEKYAEAADTIVYEVLCEVSKRVPRIYRT